MPALVFPFSRPVTPWRDRDVVARADPSKENKALAHMLHRTEIFQLGAASQFVLRKAFELIPPCHSAANRFLRLGWSVLIQGHPQNEFALAWRWNSRAMKHARNRIGIFQKGGWCDVPLSTLAWLTERGKIPGDGNEIPSA